MLYAKIVITIANVENSHETPAEIIKIFKNSKDAKIENKIIVFIIKPTNIFIFAPIENPESAIAFV